VTIPIVFAKLIDPVASGLVPNLNQPGGNITGFALYEPTLAGKWLELLSEIAPGLKRAAIMFNPDTAPGGGSYFLTSFEAAARSFKMEPIPRALSYGVDLGDIWLRAATYVDRILRGAKPADLPVQLPTKFEMAVNRKTANALGLVVPPDEVIEE
jgi:putative ABC transport system substrate-binding protein